MIGSPRSWGYKIRTCVSSLEYVHLVPNKSCVNPKNWNVAEAKNGNAEARRQSEAWSQHNQWQVEETFLDLPAAKNVPTKGHKPGSKELPGNENPKVKLLEREKETLLCNEKHPIWGHHYLSITVMLIAPPQGNSWNEPLPFRSATAIFTMTVG